MAPGARPLVVPFAFLVIALGALLPGGVASASPNLTALMLFSCDADGNPAGDFIWDTRGSDSDFYKVFVTRGTPGGSPDGLAGAFLNGPEWAAAPIDLALEPGTNQFSMFVQNNGPWHAFALNLFFNGQLVPALSVKAPLRTGEAIPPFSANHSDRSYSMTSYPTPDAPAAGTLTGLISDRRVEVTDYFVAATNRITIDRVSTHTVEINGRLDYVGTFTLVVGPQRPARNIHINIHVTEVTLCWESEAGVLYQLEYRSQGPVEWLPLGEPVAGTNGTSCVVDRIPLGDPQRFYRVTALP
jgi:hypothetical protein